MRLYFDLYWCKFQKYQGYNFNFVVNNIYDENVAKKEMLTQDIETGIELAGAAPVQCPL